MDGLKKGMEAKMDGMEAGWKLRWMIWKKMKDNMENMKSYLQEDMEDLAKLIQ